MNNKFKIIRLYIIVITFCNSLENKLIAQSNPTIQVRFQPPNGYKRTIEAQNSFEAYLRDLPLKPRNSYVTYYNGAKKPNYSVYEAVVDLPIGNKDLHQCADAVMRLRADYFYNSKQYDKIHFNFTNGFRVDYTKWAQGFRIKVKGNTTSWVKKAEPSFSYETYWQYLEQVFQFAGTASLSKELKPTRVSEIKIGDVFIKGGFPGHAVIVVDVAVNEKGKKVFLLAQSYMPAQEIQILKNPNSPTLNPWYSEDFGNKLITPEWNFTTNQLKCF
ncbi:MAG: DUF4846 domain-containing protein [Limnohabitans sp.]|nr:DUF4846 domain-containing protein [Limnohabitans sp.]